MTPQPLPFEAPRPISAERIRDDLESHGVALDFLDVIVEHLLDESPVLSEAEYQQMLRGVVLASAAVSRARAGLLENQRELQEMERLMGSFSGELTKLDEILEVLAAYARRMRSASAAVVPPVLH